MKHLSIYSTILSAILFIGCKIDSGQSFNPTELGYNMTLTAMSELESCTDMITTLRHLDDYISAEGDEREQIHDRYFYTQRIVEREEGRWEIIDSNSGDLVILTGGKSLGEAGTKWSFYYYNNEYPKDDIPWIENIADGDNARFAMHSVNTLRNKGFVDLTVSFVPYEQTSGSGIVNMEYADIEAADGYLLCTRHYYYYEDCEFSFSVQSTVRYAADKTYVHYGAFAFVSDFSGTRYTSRAEFDDNRLTVWAGKDNAYKKEYIFPTYYREW